MLEVLVVVFFRWMFLGICGIVLGVVDESYFRGFYWVYIK